MAPATSSSRRTWTTLTLWNDPGSLSAPFFEFCLRCWFGSPFMDRPGHPVDPALNRRFFGREKRAHSSCFPHFPTSVYNVSPPPSPAGTPGVSFPWPRCFSFFSSEDRKHFSPCPVGVLPTFFSSFLLLPPRPLFYRFPAQCCVSLFSFLKRLDSHPPFSLLSSSPHFEGCDTARFLAPNGP